VRPVCGLLKASFGFEDAELDGVTLVDPNLYPEHEEDKHSVQDFRVNIPRHDIDVEVQQRASPAHSDRWLVYGSKMTAGKVTWGGDYGVIVRSVVLPITFYDWLPGTRYHHWYVLKDRFSDHEYPNSPWWRPIELLKVPREFDGTLLWYWCRFFLATTPEEFDWLAEHGGPEMAEAVAVLKELSADERARLRAEAREKWLWDQAAREHTSRAEGKAEGKAEVARSMLASKMPVADIAKFTGLTEAEVKQLAAPKYWSLFGWWDDVIQHRLGTGKKSHRWWGRERGSVSFLL